MNEFHYTSYAQQVIFGAGSLARLSEEVTGFGWQRLMLCATGSLRRDGTITAVETALGERLVAVYEGVQPHVPDFQVAEALSLAEAHEVDAMIGLGGGSPIGLAKAVSMALEEKRGGKYGAGRETRRESGTSHFSHGAAAGAGGGYSHDVRGIGDDAGVRGDATRGWYGAQDYCDRCEDCAQAGYL